MKVIEPGQDWKIAALRSNFHVHFFCGGFMNNKYMDIAFEEANKAFNINEVPIGAVIVHNGEVIAKGFNTKEVDNCCISHAEIKVIREASKVMNNWRLDDCDIYVTLDPCPMCASAIKQARINTVYSACSNSDANNSEIINEIFKCDTVNPSVKLISNIDMHRTKELLSKFFKKQRNQ